MNKVFLITLLCIFSCTKEEITFREFPRIKTLAVSNITDESVTFHADLISSPVPIIDHGFLWIENGSPIFDNSDRLSLGPLSTSGLFEAVCDSGMEKGKKYFVRSYVITEANIVYSNIVEFISQGSKSPVLTDFYPSLASWGDTITLVGNNLSSVPSKTLVKFNSALATVVNASPDMLRVKVPYDILEELSKLSIASTGSSSGTVSVLDKNFQLKKPVVELVNPSSGAPNSTIVIHGKFLSSSRIRVFFNDKPALLTNLTVEAITCKVPDGLPAGPVQLKIVTGNGGLFTITSFEVI